MSASKQKGSFYCCDIDVQVVIEPKAIEVHLHRSKKNPFGEGRIDRMTEFWRDGTAFSLVLYSSIPESQFPLSECSSPGETQSTPVVLEP